MTTMNYFGNDDEYRSYAAGQSIFEKGDSGEVMYVVDEGEVDIALNGRVLETLGPGGVFGEMALIDETTRSASALARTDCRVVPINKKRFTYMVQQTPHFALKLMRILARRLRKTQEA